MKRKVFFLTIIVFLTHTSLLSANLLREKFEEATRAYNQGDHDRAIILYEETLRIHPKFAPSYYHLGLSYRAKDKNSKKVLELFEKTVELDPTHAQAYEQLGKMSYSMAKFDDAEKYSLKAVELNPQLVSAEMTLGWTYLLGKSQAEEAIHYFSHVAQKYDLTYAHLGLGMAYMMNGQRIEVMEMVTDLKRKGDHNLASQLEDMIRQGKNYQPKAPGMPAFVPTRQKSTLITATPTKPFSSQTATPNIPVRLSGRMNSSPQLSSNAVNTSNTVSAQERIRALQKRSQTLSKGSGY